ncbi:DUF4255 domain-containing protein [Methylosarcina fibrata]|uniref:DUF4255 domain-containing protein n=1 Tax=Methylosarcina fibrata TaxID=105972 RepID=UPI00037D04CC|nr:DUF4255 domain-containing protein [Methylosarcina fibrata]
MSNFLAIATVTEVLGQMILTAAENAIGGQTVVLNKKRPEDPAAADSPNVYVYLYQVTTNGALRNNDLPNRSTDGRLQKKPQAALDLYYLIAFYGNDSELESQRMLGAVVRDLHAHSILGREQIRTGLEGKSYLAGSDLAEAVELVKFTPVSLSLEENSKLWSILLQTRHALSVAYQASVVLIESEETPQQALPVSDRGVTGIPFIQPLIEQLRVLDNNGAELPINQAIELGAALLIKGKRLQGQVTQIFINDAEITAASISDSEIRLIPLADPLPDGSALRAGIKSLQIVHSVPLGEPPETHSFSGSNVFPFPLRPMPTVSMQGSAVRIRFAPKVGRTQRVFLLLNELTNNPKPKGYRLSAPKDNGITDTDVTETDTIDFPTADIVDNGTYLVRVQVDGAESLLQKDAGGKYDQPRVTVP